MSDDRIKFATMMGDNALILGQRVAEWCGHGPSLENDIALTNISLDLIGQARYWYQWLSENSSMGSEDDIAFLRDVRSYRNVLLVEQPNEDFAYTIVRQFFYDHFHFYLLSALASDESSVFNAIAKSALKEVSYHKRWSSEWLIRLGDGTKESRARAQRALDARWMYLGELTKAADFEVTLIDQGELPSFIEIEDKMRGDIDTILKEATLKRPESGWSQSGGKQGMHSEHMGHLLSELQYMQRTYPNSSW